MTEILRPDANCYASLVNWTPSAGDNYECVDEVTPNEDTDYVETTNNFSVELYSVDDTSICSGESLTLTNWFRGKYTSSESTCQHAVRSGPFGSTQYGDTETLTASYANYGFEWLTNPVTTNPWTSAEVDAYCFGMRSVSGGGGCRVTQHYVDVDCEGGTTLAPTTLPPTTLAPTTLPPTTLAPTTPEPTTLAPTTLAPTTVAPTTVPPTTLPPTTLAPTTLAPTTLAPTTIPPSTLPPTTLGPTTIGPTTIPPTTPEPTTLPPTTLGPTTPAPTTEAPTTIFHTTLAPATTLTTLAPTTAFEPVARRRGIKDFGFSFRDRWRN